MPDQPIFLSIIIPAHNEEHRLPGTLEKVVRFSRVQDFPIEIIIVENGSTDNTAAIVRDYQKNHEQESPEIVLVQILEKGKGLALKTGMLAARGKLRFMCDADLSMPIEELPRFLEISRDQKTITIASREAKGAVRYNEPQVRHIGGRLVNLMIRTLILPGLHDTQCGFKCFPEEMARYLFSRQTLTGWAFDVEVLFIARKTGIPIKEIPVPWYFNAESKVKPFQDAVRMFRDIVQIRVNYINGKYQIQQETWRGTK